jgi:hypothetical protein
MNPTVDPEVIRQARVARERLPFLPAQTARIGDTVADELDEDDVVPCPLDGDRPASNAMSKSTAARISRRVTTELARADGASRLSEASVVNSTVVYSPFPCSFTGCISRL